MDRALYVSSSGASEIMKAQAIHANNLANTTTSGFKADLEQLRSMPVYNQGLPTRVYAGAERPASDISAGGIHETGNPMDITIAGEGWFTVRGADGGEAYTRRGDLNVNSSGMLINGGGDVMMGDNGPIYIPPSNAITIQGDGSVQVQPLGSPEGTALTVGRLKLIGQNDNMNKGIDGLFTSSDKAVLPTDASVRIITGAVEESNVNPVSELMGLISLSRQHELSVKMMKTVEDNAGKLAQLLQLP